MAIRAWNELLTGPGRDIALAVDTEFEGTETLTVQFAACSGEEVRVQVYHAEGIPLPKAVWFKSLSGELSTKDGREVVVLPAKPITPALSPGRVLADIWNLPQPEYLSRTEGRRACRTGEGGRVSGKSPRPGVTVQLVGHCLPVDFLRAFGRDYWETLLLPETGEAGRVTVRGSKVIGLTGPGAEQFGAPVVEYVRHKAVLIPVRMRTFDTNVAFGSGTLDRQARSFLGVAKSGGISDAQKAHMKQVFQTMPKKAYRYAIHDAILTLLLSEQMEQLHRKVCKGLGMSANAPRCHATPGRRVADLILHDVGRGVVQPAATGTSNPAAATPSRREIKGLFHGGSAEAIGGSRFGPQTGQTHGGLLLNRSPTRLFHEAPGQFRDLDLASCYPSVLREMNVYVGRPVVWEPGNDTLPLADVVDSTWASTRPAGTGGSSRSPGRSRAPPTCSSRVPTPRSRTSTTASGRRNSGPRRPTRSSRCGSPRRRIGTTSTRRCSPTRCRPGSSCTQRGR